MFNTTLRWPNHAFDIPVEVYPGIFVSGVAFLNGVPIFCRNNNIGVIINCGGEFAKTHYGEEFKDFTDGNTNYELEYHELKISDHPTYQIKEHFEQVIDIIKDAKSKGVKILVHCLWGQSRSVSVVLAYMIKEHHYSFKQGLRYVRKTRLVAKPNSGFKRQLIAFAKDCLEEWLSGEVRLLREKIMNEVGEEVRVKE